MAIHTSANKLADFIIAKTPERRRAIIRQARRKNTGFAPWYQAFDTPATSFLAGGAADPGIIAGAIENMKSRGGSWWLDTDSRITVEAFECLLKLAPQLAALHVEFAKPGPKLDAKLHFPDLVVTVTPDMIVRGERNGKPLVGGLRFYLAKTPRYQLGQRGSELVATMVYQWLTSVASATPVPDTELCLVLELFRGKVTAAPSDTEPNIAAIAHGAREFVHLWHTIEGEEAA